MEHFGEENAQQSLLSAMNKFVNAVENMDNTVLLPSRLRDITCSKDNDKTDLTKIAPEDLYGFYKTLNGLKNELVLGPSNSISTEKLDCESKSVEMFGFHLKGLTNCLKDLTNAANTLTTRYQEELGDGPNRQSPPLTY